MKKYLLPFILSIIFILTGGVQFYQNYLFRIQPPSEEWSKEVILSKGQVKNSPKILKYHDKYIVAHDDNDNIRVLMIDNLGRKLNEKIFPGGDKFIKGVNLLTDGKFLIVNWIYAKDTDYRLISLKLDENLNMIDKWEIKDAKESIQVGEHTVAVSHSNYIEVLDVVNGKNIQIEAKGPTKLSGTFVNGTYIFTYYDGNSFNYFKIKNGTATKPEVILFRPTGVKETFFSSAFACDDKSGYIIVDRKIDNTFGDSILITFPLEGGEHNTVQVRTWFNVETFETGAGVEERLKISPGDQFTYAPASVSSGNEARFLIGYARQYGKNERQFDILDFSLKDGKIVNSTIMDKTREGTTLPYLNGEAAVFCNQTKPGEYNVCMISQNKDFKKMYNKPRKNEVFLAALDTLASFMNSILALFTRGLSWMLPSLILISLLTLFGYKLSYMKKKLAFIAVCLLAGMLKLFAVKGFYNEIYLNAMPGFLKPYINGIFIFVITSILSYLYGFLKYKRQLDVEPDTIPFFSFASAVIIDSILTLFIYSPFIM